MLVAEKSLPVPEGLRCYRLQAERASTTVYSKKAGSNLVHRYLISCMEGESG